MTKLPALSISWLVLVIPSTFAEVIALGLRRPGPQGYVHVQVFIGVMYIGAAFFCWLLRAWKVQELRKPHLSKGERENAGPNDDIMQPRNSYSNDSSGPRLHPSRHIGYFQALFAFEKV